jgi:hypothetical protein
MLFQKPYLNCEFNELQLNARNSFYIFQRNHAYSEGYQKQQREVQKYLNCRRPVKHVEKKIQYRDNGKKGIQINKDTFLEVRYSKFLHSRFQFSVHVYKHSLVSCDK